MKKILFVDDEPRVLSGLRRMLRGQRKEWQMSFVEGGREALEALAAEPHDVIVTDMRMPGMDGAQLLLAVQEKHPGLVRVVLSGHTEVEAALRALPVAHQFLNKPCEPDRLKEVVERACSLQELFANPELRDMVNRIDRLPSRPQVFNELSAALEDADVSIDRIEEIVQRDAALCAKLLQVVNSGFFGMVRRITSIREAVVYMGASLLRNLCLVVGVQSQVDRTGLPHGFSLENEHDHALATAQLARRIAPAEETENAFIAGMLVDVGRLVLASRMPEAYAGVLRRVQAGEAPDHVVERGTLGVSHADVGGYLLGIWGLPYPVAEAVTYHHGPSELARTYDLIGAVHVADALVRWKETGAEELPEEGVPGLDAEYVGRAGIGATIPRWWEEHVRPGREQGCGQ